ncbi:MAG: thiamine biosynthesis protein [Subtercola sp.]|jgi:thiamine biosynthesis lipoprotein|nr:thiamine biosynthesis protein [Subtercola sp.]
MPIHTFETMGTVASIRTRTATRPASLNRLESVFRRYDETFSLYRPASELSRIARREHELMNSTAGVRAAYAEAVEWRNLTAGDFTPHRPDGIIDLSGIVKALSMNEAATLLDRMSPEGWLLDVGGDILSSPSFDEPWHIGIVDPADRTGLLCSVLLEAPWRAVATSGTAERGEHVWRTDATGDFTQVTVVAGDIVTADVLATAILSGGRARLDAATADYAIDVITVGRAGELLTTPRLRSVLAAS